MSPTTTEAERVLACPRPGAVVLRADVDGDGENEAFSMEGVEGGQQLVRCDGDSVATIDLPFGVWYLASLDIEGDGAEEILLGAPGVDDAVERRIRFRVLEQVDGAFVINEPDWYRTTDTSGIACLDHDGDGTRDLISTHIDEDLSTESEVAWATWSPRHRAGTTGVYRVGVDDEKIAVLADLTCGDRTIEPVRVRPDAGICDERLSSYELDLDGDGRLDQFVQTYARDPITEQGPGLAVCTAAGVNDETLVAGMGEVFHVQMLDETPVLMGGGTSVGAVYRDPHVFVDGRLVPVRAAGSYLGLSTGGGPIGSAFISGCGDFDGDGISELVQVDGVRDGPVINWTRSSWELEGATAVLATEASGEVDLDESILYPASEGPNAFTELVDLDGCARADDS